MRPAQPWLLLSGQVRSGQVLGSAYSATPTLWPSSVTSDLNLELLWLVSHSGEELWRKAWEGVLGRRGPITPGGASSPRASSRPLGPTSANSGAGPESPADANVSPLSHPSWESAQLSSSLYKKKRQKKQRKLV